MEKIMKSYNQPSRGDIHVNRPLTNLSIAYMQDTGDFVAMRTFRPRPVQKQADLYYVYDTGQFNRDGMEKRAPGTETAGIGHAMSRTPYFCNVWGLHEDITDQDRANADEAIMLDQESTELISRAGLIRMEREFVSTAFADSTWNFNAQGAATRHASFDPTHATAANRALAYWNLDSSTPIEDVRLLKEYILGATGFEPNVLTLGYGAYNRLLDHPDIVGRIDRGQTANAAIVRRETLAALFEVEEVLVMKAVYNSAIEGEDPSVGFINSKNALLSYRPSTLGLKTPAAGINFMWTGYAGAPANGARMKRYRMENIASDRVEGELAFDSKVTGASLACYFKAIIQ